MKASVCALVLSIALVTSSCGRGPSAAPVPQSTKPSDQRFSSATSPSPLPDVAARLAVLKDPQKLLPALASLQQRLSLLPQNEFDVPTRATQLGGNVDRVFAFVRDDVRYEVYEGVLRGPRGTLMGQAGNSYDKSLLLGALLRHHGIDVRYARGRLPDTHAKELVDQMFASARSARAVVPSPRDATLTDAGAVSETIRVIATRRWLANLSALRATLAQGKIRLASTPPTTAVDLVREAADHVWVEYRSGDRWVALDSSKRTASPGQAPVGAAEIWTEVPQSQYHRVTIKIVVEERGQAVQTREILKHETSAEDLHGAAVSFSHETTSSALVGSVTPVLHVGDRSFSGSPLAVRGLGGGVMDLGRRLPLRPGASPPPAGGLTAEWMVIDFTPPSGKVETARREIFDRIGPAARATAQEATAPLLPLPEGQTIPPGVATIFGLSFRSGKLHPAIPLIRAAGSLDRIRAIIEASTKSRQSGRDPSVSERRALAAAVAPKVPEMLMTLATIFDLWSRRGLTYVWPQGLMFYEASPRLVIATAGPSEGPRGSATGAVSLDLRRNELRAVAEASVPGRRVVWASALRGLLDGVLEDVLVGEVLGAASGLTPTVSAVSVLDRARSTGVPLTTITTRDHVERLPASGVAQARMIESLTDQVALVAPARAIAIGGAERLGWWRVDLRSGETLSVMDNGLHFTVLEMLVVVSVVTVMAVAAVPLYYMLLDWATLLGSPWCAGTAYPLDCARYTSAYAPRPPDPLPYDAPPPPPECYPVNAVPNVGWYCD